MTTRRYLNNTIMVFGDTHFPYERKGSLEFLRDVRDTYNPDRVVCTGDILDQYHISIYPKDLKHPDSWPEELKKSRKKIKLLSNIFPELQVLESNHDDRAYKKSRIAGVPREFLVPYRDVIGAPDSWKWHRDLTLTVDSTREQIFFAHTVAGGCLTCAKDLNMTVVLGHQHTKFAATGFRPRKKTIWGIDAGSLVSDKGSPYSYNKAFRGRPINGCVILRGGEPLLVPFN